MAHRVRSQLGERSVRDLITQHLKAVLAYAKDFVKRQQFGVQAAWSIDGLPVHLMISVPQMWEMPANEVMTTAAKLAGADCAHLVYEPQCAAAFYLHDIEGQVETPGVGKVVLVADVGGGTGDSVSYKVMNSGDGARVRLASVGPGHGALCGSELVNIQFEAWLQRQARKEAKTLEALCKQLGLSAIACLKKATAAFESIKQDFSKPEHYSQFIIIRAPQG